MVEKKGVKATVKIAAEVAKPAEVKTETKPTAPEKIEVKAEVVVPVKTEAAPVGKKAKVAPAKKTVARRTAVKTTSKKGTVPKEIVKKEVAPKAEVEKEVATRAAAEKEIAKRAPAKETTEPKAAVHFQLDGKDPVAKDAPDRAMKAFKKSYRDVEIKTIDLYIVTNEGATYYVANGEGGDDYKMIL